jgi:hypothetical protein
VKKKKKPKKRVDDRARKQHGRLTLKSGTNKTKTWSTKNLISKTNSHHLILNSTLHNHLPPHGIKCPSYQIIGGPHVSMTIHTYHHPFLVPSIFTRHLFLWSQFKLGFIHSFYIIGSQLSAFKFSCIWSLNRFRPIV